MGVRDLTYLISFDAESGGLDDAATDVERLAQTLDELSGDPVEIDVEVGDLTDSAEEVDRISAALDQISDSAQFEFHVDARELNDATDDIEDLGDEIRKMERQRMQLDVDADEVERAASDVIELQEELDRFDREQFVIEMEVDLEESKQRLKDLGDQLQDLEEFDLPGVRSEVLAEYQEVEQRIQGLEQDLRDVGAAADSVGSGGGLAPIANDADRASEGMGRLRSSSDQTRSVMANLTGNALQDLGELGGVAGSAGVAISQLAEYAVDGNISLSQLGKFAGPMLGVSAAIFGATKAMEAFGSRSERTAEQTQEVADAAIEAAGLLEVLDERVSSLERSARSSGDVLEQFGASIITALTEAGDTGEIVKIQSALDTVGLSWEQLGETIAGLEADSESAMPTMLALTEAAGIPPEHVEAVAAMVHNIESLDDAALFLINTWGMEENAAIALVEQYREQIGALEQLNDAQQDNDWDDYAQKLLEVAAAADPATAALIAAAQAANPDAGAGEIWAEVAGQIDTLADATEQWGRANQEIDPNDLRWALVRDGANALREGVELTTTQLDALDALMNQYGQDEDWVLDQGLRLWEERQDSIEENRKKTGELKTETFDLAEAEREAADALAEMQAALDEVGRGLDEAADRGDAMTGVLTELGRVGELGQSQELIGFVGGLNGVVDALEDLDAATSRSEMAELDLVPDTWEEVLNMPEELAPVVQALGQFAGEVQREMSQAFEEGGAPGVIEWAANTRQAVIDSLPSDVTDEQVQEILSALGLLPEQVEMAIVLSNEERARGVIDSMASAIAGLPLETQLQIAAVADTDPIAALELAIAALEAEGVEIPVELRALFDELDGDVEGHEPPPVAVPVVCDMLPITKAIDDLTGEEKSVVVKGEADVDEVERDLDDAAKERTSPLNINIVQYAVALVLMQALASPRTATITAEAHTFAAENALDSAAAARAAPVDMFVRQRVTASDLTNIATGGQRAVRIPIDMYVRNSPRLEGKR